MSAYVSAFHCDVLTGFVVVWFQHYAACDLRSGLRDGCSRVPEVVLVWVCLQIPLRRSIVDVQTLMIRTFPVS